MALCVGNETQVSWSAHRVPRELLVGYVREARARTRLPVTTADDLDFWKEPAGHALAEELDLVVTHIHPLWRGRQLEDAVDYTGRAYARAVRGASRPDGRARGDRLGDQQDRHRRPGQAT